MPIIFDVFYSEFCRARLAEMRKQFLLWPRTPMVPEENCEGDYPDDAADSTIINGEILRLPLLPRPSLKKYGLVLLWSCQRDVPRSRSFLAAASVPPASTDPQAKSLF